ncbi:hypothetical protein [Companilactobacillus nuruki]|uniref:Uncharacterized protein n=1 Tax=Companilactobacillus nuruki TaxID=1993540 RepID=A0A2N7AXG7_9LACO|nr:hypothetical protein [Companilactobacillus nuruki]PMD73766.1 hypothetical protein CBP76_00005 [Companilactobacillus nuruki]
MKLKDILYRRQYKIELLKDVPDLKIKDLKSLGIWSNPIDKHYILTLKTANDPNETPINFENDFKKLTGLSSEDFKIEAKYGPMTLQNASDSPWI